MPAELSQLDSPIEERLAVMRRLAESLEENQLSLLRNDTEAIARGAAHQAELCRQWRQLESQLKYRPREVHKENEPAGNRRSAQLQAEWQALSARIRHLTRVHLSLLRYLDRSMTVLRNIMQSCAPTYGPEPNLVRPPELRVQAGE